MSQVVEVPPEVGGRKAFRTHTYSTHFTHTHRRGKDRSRKRRKRERERQTERERERERERESPRLVPSLLCPTSLKSRMKKVGRWSQGPLNPPNCSRPPHSQVRPDCAPTQSKNRKFSKFSSHLPVTWWTFLIPLGQSELQRLEIIPSMYDVHFRCDFTSVHTDSLTPTLKEEKEHAINSSPVRFCKSISIFPVCSKPFHSMVYHTQGQETAHRLNFLSLHRGANVSWSERL